MDYNAKTDNDESWKIELRTNFISILCGNQSLYEDIGNYYHCCAPASIYKYYKDTTENFEAIINNQMWYSVPSKFNDVFDCEIIVDKDKLLNSFLQTQQKVRIGSPAWKQAQLQVQKEALNLQGTFQKMRSEMGITCLSEVDDSLLMWAHYTNNHRGFCAEYDLIQFNEKLHFTPIPVIYSDNRVVFDSLTLETSGEDAVRVFIEGITSKSPEWSYEKEWRIIRDNSACGDKWDDVNKGALLESIQPLSIILGCEANENLENKMYQHCNANKINLYKMEKDRNRYQLNKKEILIFDD